MHHRDHSRISPLPPTPNRLQILISFYQLLTGYSNALDIQWPPYTLGFIKLMRIFNLDIFALPFVGCVMSSSFTGEFTIMTGGPVAVIAFLSLVHLLVPPLLSRLTLWRVSLQILFLIYPRTCAVM